MMQVEGLMTILDFIRYGVSKANEVELYYGHGTDNAMDDIHSLVLGSLHLDYDVPQIYWHAALTETEKKFLAQQLGKRINQRIPVPYLIHEAYFCGLPFYVDERVLIPRSPLAESIENQFAPWIEAEKVHRILDLCTGSACIAIACCYAFPDALVDAVDISSDALAVAEINRQKLEVAEQLNLIESDCFAQLQGKKYDIIVSNPPYVGEEEMKTLPKEYLHEPRLALETEKNGLAIVEKILTQAHHYLNEEGILVVEVGNSAELLMQTYPEIPFTWLEFEKGGEGVFLLTAQEVKRYFAEE